MSLLSTDALSPVVRLQVPWKGAAALSGQPWLC